MIRLIILVSALLASAATVPAAAAERRYSITDFDRVVVEGPFVVRLVPGRASSAVATGSQSALDRITVETSGQTLRIRRNRSYWGGNPGEQLGVVEIELTTRTLRSARVIGPGRLELTGASGLRVDFSVEGSGQLSASDVEADNLSIGLAGAGTVTVAGHAESLVADIQGSGNFDAARLRAENARITSASTGNVTLEVSGEANINALGIGEVVITGRPACTVRGPAADLVRCGGAR